MKKLIAFTLLLFISFNSYAAVETASSCTGCWKTGLKSCIISETLHTNCKVIDNFLAQCSQIPECSTYLKSHLESKAVDQETNSQ